MAPRNKYVVSLSYSGLNTYFVEAGSQEEAGKKAMELWLEGNNGEHTGAEFEDCASLEAELLE